MSNTTKSKSALLVSKLGLDNEDIVDTGAQIVQEIRTHSGDMLKDHQRLKLIEWIAEGCTNKQINSRASKYVDPFHVGSEILYYYKTYKQLDIVAMKRLQEANAFNTGLALRAKRIERLNTVAEVIYDHLINEDGLWVNRVKKLGRGHEAQIIVETEFNDSEVREFRMLLNDLALEVGQRVHKSDITLTAQVKGYTAVSPDDWDVVESTATPVPLALEPGSSTVESTPPASSVPEPSLPTPLHVEFNAVDPFDPALNGATNFPRPKRSPKTTAEKTARARKAAKIANDSGKTHKRKTK